MHAWTDQSEKLARAAIEYGLERLRLPKDPAWGLGFVENVSEKIQGSVSPDGLGSNKALRLFCDVIVPACRPNDSPMMLAYVPTAPTPAARITDLVLSTCTIFASHWEAGAGAIAAENEALGWLASLAGYPAGAGGCFVSGGSTANLSALVVARHVWRSSKGDDRAVGAIAANGQAHASVNAAARIMDAEVLPVDADPCGRMEPASLREVLDSNDNVFAVLATAGTTSTGAVDYLDAIADLCEERGIWLHVDAAYGGAALCAPSVRHKFAGIERTNSFAVDPHKWLFAPYDVSALIYREPLWAAEAHSQRADYLATIDRGEWNPSDFAFHLSRRARGLPLWFSLAVHGTDAYTDAVEHTLRVARRVAKHVRACEPDLNLVLEPDLSVLLIERKGWQLQDYVLFCDRIAREGRALLQAMSWGGRPVIRLCIVNPLTDSAEVESILDEARRG